MYKNIKIQKIQKRGTIATIQCGPKAKVCGGQIIEYATQKEEKEPETEKTNLIVNIKEGVPNIRRNRTIACVLNCKPRKYAYKHTHVLCERENILKKTEETEKQLNVC